MTPQELEIIREAQHRMRVLKTTGGRVGCPLGICSAFAHDMSLDLRCRICHKWMKTRFSTTRHPCQQIPDSEVKKRFWASPIQDTFRKEIRR